MSERILIVRLSALGDTALTLPLLAALAEAMPEAELGWVVSEPCAPLLEALPQLDEVHVWPKAERGLRGLWRLARSIRSYGYTAAIDAQGLTKSAAIPWLAGIQRRIGFRRAPLDARELAPVLNNELISPEPELHHVSSRMLALLAALDIEPPPMHPVDLPIEKGAYDRMRAWWDENGLGGNVLLIGVGAGWPSKVWPLSHMPCLLDAAVAAGCRCVLLWGPAERDRLEAMRAMAGTRALLAPSTDVREMVALLSLCRRYAGPDSAALHLAWLLGKPTFSWFGASDPLRCAPVGGGHVHVAARPADWNRRGPMLHELAADKVVPAFGDWMEQTKTEKGGV